mgnify:CR=1 FL=1
MFSYRPIQNILAAPRPHPLGEYLLKGEPPSTSLPCYPNPRIGGSTKASPARAYLILKKVRGEPTDIPRLPNAGQGYDKSGGGSPAQVFDAWGKPATPAYNNLIQIKGGVETEGVAEGPPAESCDTKQKLLYA